MTAALTITDARPKADLGLAAMQFSQIDRAVESAEDLDAALLASFNYAELQTTRAVEQAIVFERFVRDVIDDAKEAEASYREARRRAEAILERFKAKVQQVITEHPDQPYKCKLGRIAIQKNPPQLETVWGDKTLTPEDISLFGIDSEFYEVQTTYKLRTDHVKRYLAAGNELPWASLKQTEGVRFRK
jgi:hypothetical protein